MKKANDDSDNAISRSSQENSRGPLDRWWVQLLVTGWMLFVVVAYFRLQLLRVIEVAPR